MKIAAVVLAAGQGTRIRSDLPKVLHPLAGRPMILYALDAVAALSDVKPVLVVGHGADAVRQVVSERALFVEQVEQKGTGHAILQAREALCGQSDLVLVTYADMPLLTAETLRQLVERQRQNPGPMTLLTLLADDPRGFGRVVRDASGAVVAIVEEANATPDQLAIRELNAGAYCFAADWLWSHIGRISPSPPKQEYYLTDLIAMAAGEGLRVEAVIVQDAEEALGINTRVHLAEAESALRRRINERWMLAGVTLVDPATTYIEPDVSIGRDTVIHPNTCLRGRTRVGMHCVIGPNAIIADSQIGDHCQVLASVLERVMMEDGLSVGPFVCLRGGVRMDEARAMTDLKPARSSAGARAGKSRKAGNRQARRVGQ